VADRPLRADAQRNRDKVLHAARDAFAISGFRVPVDEIAARAGVGPGTVYRHFPTKEALFEAVVTARLADLLADARSRGSSANPGAAFFGFLQKLADDAAVKRDLPDAMTVTGPLRSELTAALDVLLQRAQDAGTVRADVTTGEIIVLLKSLFNAMREDPAGELNPAMPDRLLAVITDGLRQRG
jgi:AcrR family transcriptional regulator